jgi:hypothetical protein
VEFAYRHLEGHVRNTSNILSSLLYSYHDITLIRTSSLAIVLERILFRVTYRIGSLSKKATTHHNRQFEGLANDEG